MREIDEAAQSYDESITNPNYLVVTPIGDELVVWVTDPAYAFPLPPKWKGFKMREPRPGDICPPQVSYPSRVGYGEESRYVNNAMINSIYQAYWSTREIFWVSLALVSVFCVAVMIKVLW